MSPTPKAAVAPDAALLKAQRSVLDYLKSVGGRCPLTSLDHVLRHAVRTHFRGSTGGEVRERVVNALMASGEIVLYDPQTGSYAVRGRRWVKLAKTEGD